MSVAHSSKKINSIYIKGISSYKTQNFKKMLQKITLFLGSDFDESVDA